MTDRKRYDFTPDYRHIVNAAWNRPAERLPIYEQHFDSGITEKLTGLTSHALAFSKNMKESREGMRQFWRFYRELGFDVCCLDFFPGPESLKAAVRWAAMSMAASRIVTILSAIRGMRFRSAFSIIMVPISANLPKCVSRA